MTVYRTRVLIAPDKFKGSLTAFAVAQTVAEGMCSVRPDLVVTALPVADGGDGTVDAAVAAGFRRVPVTVSGPTGEPVAASYARRGDEAVVELADACGLARLPDGVLAPLSAGTEGLGQVMVAALDAGCASIVLGVGGSAGTDGGAGMLSALGAGLFTAGGDPIPRGGAGLAQVDRLRLTGLHPGLADVRIRLASDVDNPLTGPSGASTVYGPQKGASPAEVELLEAALTRWADLVAQAVGADGRWAAGAGAAGGVGFAAMSVLGAEPASGITTMLDILGFAARLADADLVITGEGSLDEQTLNGKAPAGVAAAAVAANTPVIAVCGRSLLTEPAWRAAGFGRVYALTTLEPDPAKSMRDAESILRRVGRQIADDLPGLLGESGLGP